MRERQTDKETEKEKESFRELFSFETGSHYVALAGQKLDM